MLLSNVIVEFCVRGGPVMVPLAVLAVMALVVVVERSVWWLREDRRRDPALLGRVLEAVASGRIGEAVEEARGSADPRVRMTAQGLGDFDGPVEGSLRMAAVGELRRAGRGLILMDTCITVAPLLGLLGTVLGIMTSFRTVRSGSEPSVEALSGGIGEALTATAAGLGVAILCVPALNYFNGRMERLRADLEIVGTQVEVLAARRRGGQIRAPASPGIAEGDADAGDAGRGTP